MKNNRRLSLEESILANHVVQILPPITRPRGVTMLLPLSELLLIQLDLFNRRSQLLLLHFLSIYNCIYAIQGFIDTQKKNSPPFKRPSSSVDFDKPTKSIATGNIFNLLCIYDDNKNFSTVPPSTWATFDCMINHYVYMIFSYYFYWIHRIKELMLTYMYVCRRSFRILIHSLFN